MLKYGIFDWLEYGEAPLDQIFEERLQMLEHADKTGFYAYHVAEHAGTPLSINNAPSVFLAAASQRTKSLRLIPTVYCLPWHDPWRLYNEICILDQLSRGRVEIGIGRGTSPIESTYYGITSQDQGREMAAEALAILVQAFTTGKLEFAGKHYNYGDIELYNKPYQKPYPPLWYPTSNFESIPYVGKEGFSTSHNFATNEVAKPHVAAVYEELKKNQDNPNRLNGHVTEPLVSNSRHIYVAPTDEEAVAQATPAFDVWSSHISYLSGRFTDRPRDSLALQRRMENKTALVGSPETVRRLIQEMVDETGINYFLGVFNFGDMKLEHVLRSMDLFTNEVIGKVEVGAASAAGS